MNEKVNFIDKDASFVDSLIEDNSFGESVDQ